MSTTYESPDADVIDLEPTFELDLARPEGPRARGGPELAEGSLVGFTGETNGLRRHRLLAAAMFLAVTFGLLGSWTFASDHPATLTVEGSRYSLRLGLVLLRCVLAAAVAGLLASELPLRRKQLIAVEYVLFLGLALLMMASFYFVGLDLMRRGHEHTSMIMPFVKDLIIQAIVLMLVYGTLIPNTPAAAAKLLVPMFVGLVASWLLLRAHPDAAETVARLSEAEQFGSNVLFLMIAVALALYITFLVHGLRSELHEARKLGEYQLVRKLGAGGMGDVYLAQHSLLKRPCALKLIKPEAGADPLALARFEREVQSSAQLSHHNTIKIYDYGHTPDGTFYYVMEYLQGMSLSDLVKQNGPLPPGRVIYLFRQVCAGLAEAHGLGLVHRDLKPANVFVALLGGETDVAKVLDFGLVKVTRDPSAVDLTAEMTVSGTPHYMAPEQAAADRSLDAQADVYALGAMMYYALTGQPPFHGANAFAIMMAHSRDPVVPPSQIRPETPHDLEEVVLRCMAKRPGDRYPGVKALREALGACTSAGEWGPNQADAWWETRGASPLPDAPGDPVGGQGEMAILPT